MLKCGAHESARLRSPHWPSLPSGGDDRGNRVVVEPTAVYWQSLPQRACGARTGRRCRQGAAIGATRSS